MGGARHDRAELAAFQDGESCLVWARRRDTGKRYYLQDGTARRDRALTKEHLECFMPECGDRRLTTVARHPRRRDGFRHHAGAGGHAPESEAHQQGKALLARWALDALGPQGVQVCMEESTSDRKRIADVMVTWPDGRQVALEMQYAGLSVQQWRERHESYREAGVVDVWLFGHIGPHLRTAPRLPGYTEDGRPPVKLGNLHHAMAVAGVPLLWLNPLLETVGTVAVSAAVHAVGGGVYGDGHDGQEFAVPPGAQDRAWFATDPLTACRLDAGRVVTPTLDRLRAAVTELETIEGTRRAADAAREEAAREREAATIRRVVARRAGEREARAREDAAWRRSDLRAALLQLHRRVPRPFSARAGAEDLVGVAPEQWRTAVYRHVMFRRVGQHFSFDDAFRSVRYEGLVAEPAARSALARSLGEWLFWLDDQNYVEVEPDLEQSSGIGRVTVLGDLGGPPPPLREPGVEAPEWRRRRHARLVRRRAKVGAGGTTRLGEAALLCVVCERRMDPVLGAGGRHVLC